MCQQTVSKLKYLNILENVNRTNNSPRNSTLIKFKLYGKPTQSINCDVNSNYMLSIVIFYLTEIMSIINQM